MRTARPRQAAGLVGEGRPPKENGPLPGPPSWDVGEYPPDCHESWSAISSPFGYFERWVLSVSGRFPWKRPFFIEKR